MAKPSSLTNAKTDVLAYFNQAVQKSYSERHIAALLLQQRHIWRLAKSTSTSDFILFLEKHGLKTHKFQSHAYDKEITRYAWGKVTPYALALSIKPHGYLSHGTAVVLHSLGKPTLDTIYLNVEQSPKSSRSGALTQDRLKLAFSRAQRTSNLVYVHGSVSVTIIAGKNTNGLGVEKIVSPSSEILTVTNLERTLIDIVVRPAYAGGSSQVLKAYRTAKEKMSVDRLLAILKQLDYVYPYHQAIGFLMQRAGYSEESYAKLRTLGLNHDFYLAHGIEQAGYSKTWRLYYPKGLRG